MTKKLPQLTFINRQKEQKYLKNYFDSIPNAILFLYGPKSCGKTTLIEKVINNLEEKKYATNYINLRGTIIENFNSFLNIFFQENSNKGVLQAITLNIGFFKLNLKDRKIFEKNPFKIMEDQLRKINEKGIKPIIIIDEIQNLKSIYMNGDRRLLDELFSFFIRLTKETHLANIVLATSDSYFIEEIYNSVKLEKTSEFYLVDHLKKSDILEWLTNYKEYNFSKKQVDYIYNYLGGSPWEIQQILVEIKNGETVEKSIEKRIKILKGKIYDFYEDQLNKKQQVIFKKISKEIAKKGFYKRISGEKIFKLIKIAIEKDFWFYEASEQKIIANSRSLEHVFGKIFT